MSITTTNISTITAGEQIFYSYFTDKLKLVLREIEAGKNNLVTATNDLDIKRIQTISEKLKNLSEKWEDLSKDAAEYLPVDCVIELLKTSQVRKYSVESIFKYQRAVTLEEREKLVKCDYTFRDVKVK